MAESCLWPRWLYLRALGLLFAGTFLSLAPQIHGLIGPHGVLPAREYFEILTARYPSAERFVLAPSLLWLDSSDRALDLLVYVGAAAAALLALGVWPRVTLFLCWLLALAFVASARSFAAFQSDSLLLESAVLGLVVAPRGLRPRLGASSPPDRLSIWLLRWLVFRLMLESGLAKLASGDSGWWRLTAMDDYYQNCPFPTWVGWWAQQLPHRFHAATVLYTLFVEILCPFAIVLGRRPRQVAFLAWLLLQLGIMLTANYATLNLNAIAAGLFLLDDRTITGVAPRLAAAGISRWRPLQRRSVGAALLYLTALQLPFAAGVEPATLPRFLRRPLEWTAGLRSANHYALFAVMTHERNEIVFEGSNDGGRTWRTYPNRWQPQALERAPRFMLIHLPRFDWALWAAALGGPQRYPFVVTTGIRLLQGEATVSALFAEDPFHGHPPRYLRFRLDRYAFTDWATRRQTGRWWTRQPVGAFAPTIPDEPGGMTRRSSRPSSADATGETIERAAPTSPMEIPSGGRRESLVGQ